MNSTIRPYLLLSIIIASTIFTGCVGLNTYPKVARAGDTTAISAGWKHYFTRDNITVTITPSSGVPTIYLPNDPAVRAAVNFYPDPVSSLVVSSETGQDITPYATTYAALVNVNTTDGDKDWWQTTVFIDLPSSLSTGSATIDITTPEGEAISTMVEIIGGIGEPESFSTQEFGALNVNHLSSLERANHFVVASGGLTVPHAIQVDMTHDPDAASGGVGVPYVINTRGDLKNIIWKDDGVNLRVILTPTKTMTLTDMKDFKFYVAGDITGLQVVGVSAFDINGSPVTGVTANVTPGG